MQRNGRSNVLVPLLALASFAALGACASTATPERRDLHSSSTLAAATDAWHAKRIERLTSEDGWLSLVALAWLEDGANRVGSDEDAEVSYARLPAPYVGTLHVDGGRVRFEQAPELAATGVALEGLPDDGMLASDATGAPTILVLGDVRFHVIDRGGRLGVRMKDARAATRTNFRGIERFPVDAAWRIVAEFVPADDGETIELGSVVGIDMPSDVAGWARFDRGGETYEALLFPNGDGYTLRFSDATAGRETYTIGRYLSVDPSEDGATVVLDFNRAYNPPCAFTPFATCSLAPEANQFAFAVTAGERTPGSH